MELKECKLCKQVKSVSEYSFRKDSGRYRNECKVCLAARQKLQRVLNGDHVRQIDRDSYARNIESKRQQKKVYREKYKDIIRERKSLYKKTHRAVVNAANMRRETFKRNASVSWADNSKILSFYTKAKRFEAWLGTSFHVDHIVPLSNEIVCGLHNEFNLQVLTATDNIRKKEYL